MCDAASMISSPSVSAARLPSGSVRARISVAALVAGVSGCAMSMLGAPVQVEGVEHRVALGGGGGDLLQLARDIAADESPRKTG